MQKTFFSTILLLTLLFLILPMQAQEKAPVNITASIDLVNQNVWRGCYQAGASLQPEAIISVSGWQFSVWGSTDFRAEEKEIDLTVKYLLGDFSIGVTDYWFDKQDAPYSKNHWLEGNLNYQCRNLPLSIGYNMLVAGENNRFSPYMETIYSPEWKDWNLELAAGFTPWSNTLLNTDGLAFTRISAGIRKTLMLSNSYSIEAYTTLLYNPDADCAFWMAGINIPF